MMPFFTKVIATADYTWRPTDCVCDPSPDRDATPAEITAGLPARVFDVRVNLSATLANGAMVTHTRTHTYPAAVKAGIIGFDPVKMAPTINWQAVAQMFAEFDLSIPQ